MKYFSLLFLLYFTGCRHQIRIESYPNSAMISHNGQELGLTPIEISFWWFPFRSFPLDVHLNGYRDLTIYGGSSINLRTVTGDILHFRMKELLGRKTRNTHTVQLIREHGPAGTWTPEDAM